MTQTATNNAQQMIEQVFDSYTWRQFENVCTGRPEFNVFFPEKVVDGETWPAVFETSVAVNDEDGRPTWHRIRVYDGLAKLFNSHLKEGNKVARINAQGYVRSRTYADRQGNEKVVHYTVIPNKTDDYGYQFLKVLSTWQHMRDSSGGKDPFATASNAAQATSRAEDERTNAAEAAQSRGDDMHGLASQQSDEVPQWAVSEDEGDSQFAMPTAPMDDVSDVPF